MFYKNNKTNKKIKQINTCSIILNKNNLNILKKNILRFSNYIEIN